MGETTKGEGFFSSLVYALIRLKCVWNNSMGQAEKISTGGNYNLTHAIIMRRQSLFSLSPRPLRRAWFRGYKRARATRLYPSFIHTAPVYV